jgi:hypothetical protein
VREDYVIVDPPSTMDTAATALYALGLPIPAELVGKPRFDIFTDQPQAALPAAVLPQPVAPH